jgi:hypothetical protein
MGTKVGINEIGSYRAQFKAAEKDNEGMALKIFTKAKLFPKAYRI